MGLFLAGSAARADTAARFYLVVPESFKEELTEPSDIVELYGRGGTKLRGREVRLAVRSEKSVSDPFMQKYLRLSWASYLERTNRLYFQHRLAKLPVIVSGQEFLVSLGVYPDLVVYFTAEELSQITLPDGFIALPIQ